MTTVPGTREFLVGDGAAVDRIPVGPANPSFVFGSSSDRLRASERVEGGANRAASYDRVVGSQRPAGGSIGRLATAIDGMRATAETASGGTGAGSDAVLREIAGTLVVMSGHLNDLLDARPER